VSVVVALVGAVLGAIMAPGRGGVRRAPIADVNPRILSKGGDLLADRLVTHTVTA
jgi:hypothetical protein